MIQMLCPVIFGESRIYTYIDVLCLVKPEARTPYGCGKGGGESGGGGRVLPYVDCTGMCCCTG